MKRRRQECLLMRWRMSQSITELAKLPTRSELTDLSNIPLIFMGGSMGLGDSGDERIVSMSFLSTRLRFETEADVLAIKLTSSAGYDPEALVNYISRVQTAKVYSSLPPRDIRITNMEKAIQELSPRVYPSASDEFPSIQGEVRRLLSH